MTDIPENLPDMYKNVLKYMDNDFVRVAHLRDSTTFCNDMYEQTLKKVVDLGTIRKDRTGVGTLSTFGLQMEFYLSLYFPLVTTKKVYLKGVIAELLWFLNGDTNIKYLNDNGVHIWDEWADENGDLGPIYGKQWHDWNGDHIDQIQNAIDLIKNDPYSRRIIVSAWNPSQIPDMALPVLCYGIRTS